MENEKQKLIDICFQLVLVARDWEDFKKKDKQTLAKWVASQLEQCGFPTHPVGSSWGVLIEDPELLQKLRSNE